jgi:hypothetical protein
MNLNGQLKELAQQYVKFQKSLNYYQTQALPQADLIISNSDKVLEAVIFPIHNICKTLRYPIISIQSI